MGRIRPILAVHLQAPGPHRLLPHRTTMPTRRSLFRAPLVLGAAPVGFALVQVGDAAPAVAAGDNVRSLDDALEDLREVRRLLTRVSDARLREDLERLLGRTESRVADVRRDLARGDASARRDDGPSRRAVPNDRFGQLVQSIRSESFDNKRLELVKIAAKGGRFTCDQARELLSVFSFDNHRVDALVAIYPTLVDREQVPTLRPAFTFGSNWDTALRRLNLK